MSNPNERWHETMPDGTERIFAHPCDDVASVRITADPMIELEFDAARSLRADTFNVRKVDALWRIEAFVRSSKGDVLSIVVFVQEHDRGEPRRRTPDGRPALLMHIGEEGHAIVEAVRLHIELPFAAVALVGWSPPRPNAN